MYELYRPQLPPNEPFEALVWPEIPSLCGSWLGACGPLTPDSKTRLRAIPPQSLGLKDSSLVNPKRVLEIQSLESLV